MRIRIAIPAALFVCLAVSSLPAAAQTVGIFVPPLSAAQAQDIAVANGVIAIRKIEFDDGAWKVEGLDRENRRVEMKIHPQTGEIIRLERYY
jgi:hypothetical protein